MNVNILADLSSQILSWDELERRGSAQSTRMRPVSQSMEETVFRVRVAAK